VPERELIKVRMMTSSFNNDYSLKRRWSSQRQMGERGRERGSERD